MTALRKLLGSLQRRRRAAFLPWEEYAERMAVLELHAWREQTRRRSLANADAL